MKKLLLITMLIGITTDSHAQNTPASSTSPCVAIAKIERTLPRSKAPEHLLMRMGKLAEDVEKDSPLEMAAYRKNSDYKSICRYKIVHSENFGDFPSYSGYHYMQILKKYPHSEWVDDAAYALIYVITESTYNYSDVRIEKQKLERFLKRYPKSNKAKEARARIRQIDKQLANGEPAILD